jgi:hypothetical protein
VQVQVHAHQTCSPMVPLCKCHVENGTVVVEV